MFLKTRQLDIQSFGVVNFWPVLLVFPAFETIHQAPANPDRTFCFPFTYITKILSRHVFIKPPEAFLSIDGFYKFFH